MAGQARLVLFRCWVCWEWHSTYLHHCNLGQHGSNVLGTADTLNLLALPISLQHCIDMTSLRVLLVLLVWRYG